MMSLETVERALAEFYCNQNVEVHKILLDFQNSVDAWNLVWNMLNTSKVSSIIDYWLIILLFIIMFQQFTHFSLMRYNFLVLLHFTSKLPNNGYN